jgi:hypothetical protein
METVRHSMLRKKYNNNNNKPHVKDGPLFHVSFNAFRVKNDGVDR